MTAEVRQNLAEGVARKRDRAAASTILADYITEGELATELKRCRQTLRLWRRLGEGPPATKIGKDIYYHVDGIRAWLKAQSIRAA